MFLNIHADDIPLVCKPGDVEWFQSTVGETLAMKVDGPHMPGDGSQVMYFKKRMTMKAEGILLQPRATYIPKLVGLMRVSGRRRKGLPYHATSLSTQTCWWKVNCLALNKQQTSDQVLD